MHGEQVACEDRIGASVDEPGELPGALITVNERNLHKWAKDRLTEPSGLRVLSVGVKPGQRSRVSQDRRRAAHPRTERDHEQRRD